MKDLALNIHQLNRHNVVLLGSALGSWIAQIHGRKEDGRGLGGHFLCML